MPLVLPRTCRAVFPPRNHYVPTVVRLDQVWWDKWMVDQFEMNGFGFQQRHDLMHRALRSIEARVPQTRVSYPANQEAQYYALLQYQERDNMAPNVRITRIDDRCRRGTRPACGGPFARPALPLLPPFAGNPAAIPAAGPAMPSAENSAPPPAGGSLALPGGLSPALSTQTRGFPFSANSSPLPTGSQAPLSPTHSPSLPTGSPALSSAADPPSPSTVESARATATSSPRLVTGSSGPPSAADSPPPSAADPSPHLAGDTPPASAADSPLPSAENSPKLRASGSSMPDLVTLPMGGINMRQTTSTIGLEPILRRMAARSEEEAEESQ